MAAVIMTTWDLALDPIWSTIEHGWIWQHGGPYFGVPISNYFGWLLTVFVFCWCFQFYLRRFGTRHAPQSPYWKEAIAFYAVAGLGNCLLVFRLRFHAPMADATGAIWSVTSILQACCLVSVLGMGGIAALAWQKAGRLK
jgi:putative membrane protein